MDKKLEISNLKQVGGETDGFICKLCHKLSDESEGRMGKIGMICDNCEEEPDLERETKDNVKEKTTDYQSLNSFTNETKKDKEKTIQIINIEELNNKITIPSELNIIDCPSDVNPNPEWFRIQFKNF